MNNKGFTLIEMLVVVAIIGLLSSTILIGLGNARTRARDARRISDLRQVQNGLENYYVENRQAYPNDAYNVVIGLPVDPQGGEYGYVRLSTQSYVLGTCLENDRSSDIQSFIGNYDVSPVGSPLIPPPACNCEDSNSYCVAIGIGGR